MNDRYLVFEKRTDKWRSYRSQIIKDSMQSENQVMGNKKIKSIINDINNIDKNILIDFNKDETFQLANVGIIQNQVTLEESYYPLKFAIPNLDDQKLSDIKAEVEKINDQSSQYFILNENNQINLDKIENFKKIKDNTMVSINALFGSVQTEIQNFPTEAKARLKKLSTTIDEIKNKKDNDFKPIIEKQFDSSFNYKITYLVVIGAIGVLLLAAILVVILWLVL